MISADFAPNERFTDALSSLITLAFPMSWKEGPERAAAARRLNAMFPGASATLFMSGRGSLAIALSALAVGKGTEVIVQGFTCEAVVLPILHHGSTPVYADIETDTFSLDPSSLEKKITGRTRVIILQHTFGLVPKYRDRVLQLAKEKNITVIEDLAHGFEPEFWQKQRLSDKQLLLLSFGRSKALSSVFGGAILTADPAIKAKVRLIEADTPYPGYGFLARLLCYKPITWISKKTYNFLGTGKLIHYLGKNLGLLTAEISRKEKKGEYDPYLEKKYPNVLAKLLNLQLSDYGKTVEVRRAVTNVYRRYFPLSSTSVPTRYPVLTRERDRILNDVSKKGIYLGSWYTQPVAPKELKLDRVNYTMGSCPVAEKICGRILNLPTRITVPEATEIAETIKAQ